MNKVNPDLHIHWCRKNEIEWVNEKYEEIHFKFSTLETDHIAIATCNSEYVGLGRLCCIENSIFELGGMYVHPNYRGLGIARKIVRFLLESKIPSSTVYCLPFIHLQDFYESEGFQTVPEQAYYQIPKEILEKHRWCNETYLHKVLLLYRT